MADKPTHCIRCGEELLTEADYQTGICADCWTDEDYEEGDEFDPNDWYPTDADQKYIEDGYADAEALASAGMGTDEDYGYYGDDY